MTLSALKAFKTHAFASSGKPKDIDELFPDGHVDVKGLRNIVDVDAYEREIAVQRRLNPDATDWVVRYTAWRRTLDGENTPGPVPAPAPAA